MMPYSGHHEHRPFGDGMTPADDEMFDSSDVLLQHESETDRDVDTIDIDPLKVVVVDAVTVNRIVPQHIQCYTVVLTSDQPVQKLLEQDLMRTAADVVSIDHDVVLCHSYQQANDLDNQSATLARPNGSILATSGTYPFFFNVDTTAELWVVGNTFPSRVSVVVKRRSA